MGRLSEYSDEDADRIRGILETLETADDYWSLKLQERKTRLSSILDINAPDSMLETECMLVIIALNKGTKNALSQVTDYMIDLIIREAEHESRL